MQRRKKEQMFSLKKKNNVTATCTCVLSHLRKKYDYEYVVYFEPFVCFPLTFFLTSKKEEE